MSHKLQIVCCLLVLGFLCACSKSKSSAQSKSNKTIINEKIAASNDFIFDSLKSLQASNYHKHYTSYKLIADSEITFTSGNEDRTKRFEEKCVVYNQNEKTLVKLSTTPSEYIEAYNLGEKYFTGLKGEPLSSNANSRAIFENLEHEVFSVASFYLELLHGSLDFEKRSDLAIDKHDVYNVYQIKLKRRESKFERIGMIVQQNKATTPNPSHSALHQMLNSAYPLNINGQIHVDPKTKLITHVDLMATLVVGSNEEPKEINLSLAMQVSKEDVSAQIYPTLASNRNTRSISSTPKDLKGFIAKLNAKKENVAN